MTVRLQYGDLGHMKGEPARQEQNLDRHDGHATPRQHAEEGEQRAGEHIGIRRAAMREDRRAGTPHVIRVRAIAHSFQREVGLDGTAEVEGAIGEQRPAIVRCLLAPDKGGDLGFEQGIGWLSEKMPEQNVFGRDRNIGFQFEDKMPIGALDVQQRLPRARDRRVDAGEFAIRRGWRLRDTVDLFHQAAPYPYPIAAILSAAR